MRSLQVLYIHMTFCLMIAASPLSSGDEKIEGGPDAVYNVINTTIHQTNQTTQTTEKSINRSKSSAASTATTLPSGTNPIHYQPTLCADLSINSDKEGRPTTPPYNRLIDSINRQLETISYTTNQQTRIEKLQALENEVRDANNELLPDSVLRQLCRTLTIIDQSVETDLAGLAIDDWKVQLDQVQANYDYAAHRLKKTDEQKLLAELMKNYEKSVRPVLKASELVELKVGLTLKQIDVDEKNQVLTVLVWLDQEWVDEKMIWDPANYSGLEVMRVPCHLLWLPDVVLYNSVEDLREGYMQALAMVQHQGVVFWPPIVKYRGNCEIEIKYFPFDDQVCKLKLGTWAYDGSQVNLTKLKDAIDVSNYQRNGEWKLLKTETIRNVEHYTCCPAPFIDVTFTLYLQRRTLYYVYNIIIPCIMLSILTLLSFWMKPDSGEKINLGLTILLAFSVFMLLIAESMPSTSFHVPIIGIYITSSMCLTSFSVVSAVFVANIDRQAEGDRVVPYWIHKVCHQLGRVMCVKMVSWEERHCNIRQLAMQSAASKLSVNSQNDVVVQATSPLLPRLKRDSNGVFAMTSMKGSPNKKGSRKEKMSNGTNGTNVKDEQTDPGEDDPLLKRLHTIVEHQEELLKKQNTSDDWHAVATIIDRCLFWIYAIMMASTTIGCIVVFPTTKVSVTSDGDYLLL